MFTTYILIPGFPTLQLIILTFWKLVQVVLFKILEGVSLTFDQHCLAKDKKVFSLVLSGGNVIYFCIFSKKSHIFIFLLSRCQLKLRYSKLNQVSLLQEIR